MNPSNFIDLKGQKFVRLSVVRLASEYNKRQGAYWVCLCDCGSERKVLGRDLRTGKTRSCGCLHNEEASQLHRGEFGECARNQCFNQYRRNASKRKILFDLTKEEFFTLTKGNCFYCGAKPSQEVIVPSGNGSYIYNGIDRLDNSKGYSIENCVPACGVHNLMKLDMSFAEFIAACQAVIDYQNQNLLQIAS